MSLTSYRAAPPRARVLFVFYVWCFVVYFIINAKNRPVLDGYVDFDYVCRSLVNGALLMQSVLIVLKIYSYQRQVAFS